MTGSKSIFIEDLCGHAKISTYQAKIGMNCPTKISQSSDKNRYGMDHSRYNATIQFRDLEIISPCLIKCQSYKFRETWQYVIHN